MKRIKEIIPYLYDLVLQFPFKKYWVIGISFFIFFFFTLISFYKNFPPHPIIKNINASLHPFGMEIKAEETKISFPFKIRFLSPEISYKNKRLLSPQEMSIRIYPLKYIFGKKGLKTKIKTEEGYAEFDMTFYKKNLNFKIKGRNFRYEGEIEMPLYKLSYSLFLNGQIEGKINTEEISSSDINGNVEIKNFVLKNLEVGNFELKDIQIGEMESRITGKNGSISFGDISFKGSDLEGNVNLEIILSRKLTLSRLKGNLSVKLGFRLRQMIEDMHLPSQVFLKDGNRIDLKIGGTLGNPSFSML
jgi:type II secretion system protein N